MMTKTWTQRISVVVASLTLLAFLATQLPTSADVKLAEQNGYNVFSVVQTFANGITITGGSLVVNGVPISAGGDVVGPSSSNNGEIVLFDQGTGKLVKAATGSGLVHATSGVYSAADADIGDDTNLAAGRSLTLSGDSVEADTELFTKTKCINIDPDATTTDWIFFRAEAAITVTGIDCLVDAATSVVATVQECDGNGANCSNIEAAITCAATNTTEATSIDNASVDAGDWVRVTRGTKTGSPTQVNVCVTYTVDD
jgi:hypothetical protein